jgi:cytochrome c553
MRSIVVLVLLAMLFLGCKDTSRTKEKKRPDFYGKQMYKNEHPGKKLMETYCYACHDASTPEDKRLAPPMIAIKRRYIFKDTSKEAFIDDMQAWIKNPNETDAKMFGAVKRFGVMLKISYPEKVIEQIADYMYTHDIEQPDWFEDHFNQRSRGGMRQ